MKKEHSGNMTQRKRRMKTAAEQAIPHGADWVQRIRSRFTGLGDVDLPQPARGTMRELPEPFAGENKR